MNTIHECRWITAVIVAALPIACLTARADVITEWNIKAGQVVVDAKLGAPQANNVLAIVQTAVYEAANAISGPLRGKA